MRTTVFIAAACALFAAPAFAQSKATIEKQNAAFAKAFNSGDAAAVARLYADDAVVLPPGADMVKGKTAIETFWKKASEQLGNAKLTVVSVKPLGNRAAREIGTFSLTTKSQPPQEIVGKYVVVWQKVGAEWKLATDIWNTNK